MRKALIREPEREATAAKFEIAHHGTLFLDEISNMPIDMQSKLLRVLQDNKVYRIGSYHPISVDVQVIAATNRDLKKKLREAISEKIYFIV